MHHTFHIPVLGLAYSVDTPAKVARFGISSVVSIVQDELLEHMRQYHSLKNNFPYYPITKATYDFRAKRVTAYLNMLKTLVNEQVEKLKNEPFAPGTEITKYFNLLPDHHTLKKLYQRMTGSSGSEQHQLQQHLRENISAGSIDVNIMTKLDHNDYALDTGEMDPALFSDAMASLRGYAKSDLHSSIIFSAGLNPKLYSYLETFPDFFPDGKGQINKRVIIKVSDYRSALIQGKFLAKKGIWVSEFRIESGLNCGGHAFPTDGYLLGPVLEEFKQKRAELETELKTMVNETLTSKQQPLLSSSEKVRISVQGGIGTGVEDAFLKTYYGMDATGWGSPFLLVPEATNVDENTLKALSQASPQDYYLSHASPLGVPFNNFRKSSAEQQRQSRIQNGRPGSPCFQKHLSFNTEFTDKPICTASRKYQHHKLKAIEQLHLTPEKHREQVAAITEKDCLCEGLSASAYLVHQQQVPHHLEAVTICPGPNLAYFSGVFTLEQMVDHIYGRQTILNQIDRPHVFINELNMYIDYFQKEVNKHLGQMNEKVVRSLQQFKENLLSGISYYLCLESLKAYHETLTRAQEQLMQTPVYAQEVVTTV